MSVWEREAFDDHEIVSFFHDLQSGLRAIIAVHSKTLGPGAGGVRMWSYDDSGEALRDVLRLSRGMSYKSAVAGLPLGGAKAVIMKPAGAFDRRPLFEAYGRAVDTLGGRYITAEDVGVGPDDMRVVRTQTRYVGGLTEGAAASGDPSPVTARGVFMGLKAAVRRALDRDDLKGVRVAVQGVGHVGATLCELLADAGARLVVTDVNRSAVGDVVARFAAEAVEPDAIYDAEVDVFAPCALGGVINAATIDRLRCAAIAGAANNQLETPDMGQALLARGILYAPDYVLNAGGIINVASEVTGSYDPVWVDEKLDAMTASLETIFDRAAREGRPTSDVADALARERIAQAKREPVEA